LKLLSPEVYTSALQGDVKPLVPGCWLVLALSSYSWLPCVLVVSLIEMKNFIHPVSRTLLV